MKILGIHSGVTLRQHDPGAALIVDGKLVAAIEEERLLRVKSPRGHLPIRAIRACLKQAGITINDIDLIGHAGETYQDMPARIRQYMSHYFGCCPEIRMLNHQTAHLASAFFCSNFEEAMCISWDGYGDELSASFAVADRTKGIQILETRDDQNSLGSLYEVFTSFIGFNPGEDEFKVMGLAAYGIEERDISCFARPSEDGYHIDQSFMRNTPPLMSRFEPRYSEELTSHLGVQPRQVGGPIEQIHRDIALSVQRALERCTQSTVRYLHDKTKLRRLCLAGGVALNCSANMRLQQMDCIDELFVQPAASDRGLPLGCALQLAFDVGEPVFGIDHVYLGPALEEGLIEKTLKLTGFEYTIAEDPAVVGARLIADGKIVGWFQGRSEFGPRALGNRSILADPSRPEMKDELNGRVKFREEFRPFAPAVVEERAFDIFDIGNPHPYMTIACNVRDHWRERLPAVTHVDGTARVQTVSRDTNQIFHRLISKFGELSGIPVVLNTSFNVRGQPIVETPIDAIGTFSATGMDALIMDRYVVHKQAPCRIDSKPLT